MVRNSDVGKETGLTQFHKLTPVTFSVNKSNSQENGQSFTNDLRYNIEKRKLFSNLVPSQDLLLGKILGKVKGFPSISFNAEETNHLALKLRLALESHNSEPLPLHNKFSLLRNLREEVGHLFYNSHDDSHHMEDTSRATFTIIKAMGLDEEALELADDDEETPPVYHSEGEIQPSIMDPSPIQTLPAQLERKIKALTQEKFYPSFSVLTRSQSKKYGVN
ncbi:hypothetical protein DM860_017990 [Cuscuta australis]|uniref:Uncharacterized protein n=1 Tax=Cuscuta australis TaxID=267555 RepID=A0A328EAD5_9ASTE|nr:hypothetical protein DM860_017990 [Cuscuta australis]